MIGFFRRIRKKLADENRFFQYSRYAIGEIVLVVIGILIALQINNWNQERKDRVLEKNYLNRIVSELKMDVTILTDKIQKADRLRNRYLISIKNMYQIQESKEEFIELMSNVEYDVEELILTDIAYSELVNSGKLDLIHDSELKNKITRYYRNYDFVASRLREMNSSNLVSFNNAHQIAPIKKYSVQGYIGLIPENIFAEDDYMFSESDWDFINKPKSLEFRLHEDAIYYYYVKQVLLKPLIIQLSEQAKVIIEQLEDVN